MRTSPMMRMMTTAELHFILLIGEVQNCTWGGSFCLLIRSKTWTGIDILGRRKYPNATI